MIALKGGEAQMRFYSMTRFAGTWLVARLNIKNERGATAVEYGVMVALIAAVIIVAVVALGKQASTSFQCTADSISTKVNSC